MTCRSATREPSPTLSRRMPLRRARTQARRVTARLSAFRRAHLDFSGIDEIGPAFADELFRVYARAHPQVQLVPEAAAPRVAAMIASVQ